MIEKCTKACILLLKCFKDDRRESQVTLMTILLRAPKRLYARFILMLKNEERERKKEGRKKEAYRGSALQA